jgi:hypothetical protein
MFSWDGEAEEALELEPDLRTDRKDMFFSPFFLERNIDVFSPH